MDQRYKSLGDGRKVCSECYESAVMATKDCQPLYRDILKFYRDNLGMPIVQEVPMLLVEREALNNAREIEKDVSSYSHRKILCRLPFSFVQIKFYHIFDGLIIPVCVMNTGTHPRTRNSRSVFVGRANPSCKITGPPFQEISHVLPC